MNMKNYTAKDIKVLSDREHVRLRPDIYLGSSSIEHYQIPLFIDQNAISISDVAFIPAVYKAIGEIIDNSIDEFSHLAKSNDHQLTIKCNTLLGEYTIADNGRGVPIEIHETGMYTPQVVFGSMKSGRNFDDREIGIIGQNGVGSSCTNIVSSEFMIDIKRDKKQYTQIFYNGNSTCTPPNIVPYKGKDTGTSITFTLDPEIFESIVLPEELIHNRAIELALCNAGLNVVYNDKKYKYRHGFESLISSVSKDYFRFSVSDDIEFYVIFDIAESESEQIFTWVNSSFLFGGGICNTQFVNAFIDKTIDHLSSSAKKNKIQLDKRDVKQNLMIIGNLKLKHPKYDSQAKIRITAPNIRKELDDLIESMWGQFTRKNKDWLNVVLERAIERHRKDSTAKAVKNLKKDSNKRIPGLLDAIGKDRKQCALYITEGNSAASSIIEVRDPKIHASFPLRGKIDNTYGYTIADILKMDKLADLIKAIGLIPGEKATFDTCRFGKICISTDADYDGSDIFTLLINTFYRWPELFDDTTDCPKIYRLVSPNVICLKGKNRTYFQNKDQYELAKQSGKIREGSEIRYIKGLGGLEMDDWKNILYNEEYYVRIIDDDNFTSVLELLFSKDTEQRKLWLQNEHTRIKRITR